MSQLVDIEHMASFGRPLWFANLLSSREAGAPDSSIIDLAARKLMADMRLDDLMNAVKTNF